MTRLTLVSLIMFILSAHATTHAQTVVAPAKKSLTQAADEPAQKFDADGKVNEGFAKAHERFLDVAQAGVTELLFLGDSITAGWAGQNEIWENAFGSYKPANFGIGGDRTQHVLWRIENGELDGIHPKVVVLMIGTNNVGPDSAEDVASGITKIVETIRTKQPQAKILLLAVFPRGERAESNPVRDTLTKVNKIIAKLDDGQHVYFLDINDKFLHPDGSFSKDISPDFVHLTAAGYQIWADAIGPKLAELMKQ